MCSAKVASYVCYWFPWWCLQNWWLQLHLPSSVHVRVYKGALELKRLFLSLHVLVFLVWNYNAAEFPEIWYIGVFFGQQNNWFFLEWVKEMAFKSGVLNRRRKREEAVDAKTPYGPPAIRNLIQLPALFQLWYKNTEFLSDWLSKHFLHTKFSPERVHPSPWNVPLSVEKVSTLQLLFPFMGRVLPDSERCAWDISGTKRGHFWRKGIFQYLSFGRLDHQKQEGKGGREAESSVMALSSSILVVPPVSDLLSLLSSDSSQGTSRCPLTDACCLFSQIVWKISFGQKPKCEGAILF